MKKLKNIFSFKVLTVVLLALNLFFLVYIAKGIGHEIIINRDLPQPALVNMATGIYKQLYDLKGQKCLTSQDIPNYSQQLDELSSGIQEIKSTIDNIDINTKYLH